MPRCDLRNGAVELCLLRKQPLLLGDQSQNLAPSSGPLAFQAIILGHQTIAFQGEA